MDKANKIQSRKNKLAGSVGLLAMLLSACQSDQTVVVTSQSAAKAPNVQASETTCPKQVYWGDTHLHTVNSADAIFNGVRLTAEDAFRFARGDRVKSTSGVDAQLARPLDFLLVSDHVELMGIGAQIAAGIPEMLADPVTKRWHEMLNSNATDSVQAAREVVSSYIGKTLPEPMRNPETVSRLLKSTWSQYLETTERYNQPGKFTTLIGYEYSSTPKGDNLHRIVMFRDGLDVFGDTLPFSSNESPDPEDLWAYLAAYEERTGGKALAIPHNSNVSNGLMFATTNYEGDPLTKDYAERRQRWEPIVEATQIKGDSESHPILSPDDEFAAFGDTGWDIGNLANSSPKTPDMLPGDYLRGALKRGLELEAELGVNPFQFGMIGATDSHTALATGDEDNFFGKYSNDEPGTERVNVADGPAGPGRVGWQYLAGGYAGVWAPANTRKALFDSMARREVYATTGPRMTVRMFAGWDIAKSDIVADPCSLYDRAVPMGGNISGSNGQPPRFLVTALKDPEGANLDRAQIVKGWRDSNGELQERVYNIAWSDADSRKISANGKLPAVGNTVNIATASYENSIGAAQLQTVWTDPDFDPTESGFYYVRVLAIPTPRWPVFDALRYGTSLTDTVELTSQERAYGSPIWYSPKN